MAAILKAPGRRMTLAEGNYQSPETSASRSLLAPLTPPPDKAVQPVLTADELRQEFGATGTAFFPGYLLNTEYLTDLRGRKGTDIYEQMRRSDAMVKALLAVVKLPILSATWYIECEDEEKKNFLQEALFRRIDFHEYVKHALMMLDFGFEALEKVYDIDEDDSGQTRIFLRKLAHRGQKTIYWWKGDPNGDLWSIVQIVWKNGHYQTLEIPAIKLVRFTYDQEGNNFEGISMLRAAYQHWFIKSQIYKIDAIAHERFGVGIPVAKQPEGTLNQKEIDAMSTALGNYKTGAQAYFNLPHGWEITILGAGEAQRYNPWESIKHHDQAIPKVALAEFLNYGMTETGSRAQMGNAQELFTASLQAVCNQIVNVTNKDVVFDLLSKNFADASPMDASLRYSDLEVQSLAKIADSIQKLGSVGFLTPDADLEEHLRDIADLPQRPGQTSQAASERRPHNGRLPALRLQQAPGPRGKEGFWRDLTGPEKSVALREIDGRQDDAKTHILDLVGRLKQRWADSLKGQIRQDLSGGKPSDLADIAIPEDLKRPLLSGVIATFRDLYRYGGRTIGEEMIRQKRTETVDRVGLRDEPPDPQDLTDLFWTRGKLFLDRLSSKVENRAKDLALTLYRTKHQDFTDADLDAITDELLSVSDQAATLEANVLVGEAVNLGRQAQADNLKDQIEAAVYSAILDENTCEVCQALDGEGFDVGSQEYYDEAPPNRNCEGGDRCRCLYVYEFKTGEGEE